MKSLVVRALALIRRVFFWLPSADKSAEYLPETGHDHALILAVTGTRKIPTFRQLRYGIRVVLSDRERRLMAFSLFIFLLSGGTSLAFLINQRTIRVPVAGGTITEAIIGEPKYLNPLDAPANDVDRDITSLIYSGLFRMDGMEAVPDLAEKYSWSPDGKTLTVTLRDGARFHNGDEVTTDDIQFTIDSIQDPARLSRLASRFRGIKAIATDDHTVQFVQEQPDITLLQALTVGILPARLWQDIPATNARLADLNMKPIGSGPFIFKSFIRDSRGFVRTFTLERWDGYYGIKPNLKNIVFHFYPDRKQAEDALKADLVETLAFADLQDGSTESSRWYQVQLQMPQETIAFFNVKNKILAEEKVRRALSGVIDRQEVIDAWNGRAVSVDGPLPFSAGTSTVVDLDQARALLEASGWKLPAEGSVRIGSTSSTELALTVVTSKKQELVAVAETLKRRWSLIGAKVTIEVLESDELLRRATRERNSQIILTNILLDPTLDLFPFWWSGQASDRGFNFSNLADRDLDSALEVTRTASTTEALQKARVNLASIIKRSTPAAFLVRPASTYLISKRIKGVSADVVISSPAGRFQDLMHWYVKTGWRWK